VKSPRVLIYVQHLLGIGHLMRAAMISRALAEGGCKTVLVSGGLPVPDLELGGAVLQQLPPVYASEDFARLLNERGEEIDDRFKAARRDQLVDFWRTFQPDVVVTELFPFGRRQMRYELVPLLEAATGSATPPIVIASVRDILQARAPTRVREALQWFGRYYDHLLVHADPGVVKLEVSVPAVIGITDRTHYTGYVVGTEMAPNAGTHSDGGEVVVSAGGGAVGEAVLRAAIDARSATIYWDRTWRLLAGRNMTRNAFETLRGIASSGVVIERVRSDFAALLAAGALSISQCGYNTMMDVLRAGIRAVVVPFAGDSETEQTMRADVWAARGGVHVVSEDDLSPATLAVAVNQAAESAPTAISELNFDGAHKSANFIKEVASARVSSR